MALSSADQADLLAMVPAMEAAWRARDAEAYAGQFTEDAEHINAYGMWWRGRREIAEGIGFALNVVYRDNPIVARDVSLIPLGEDVALVQYRWRLNPYADPDGAQHDDPEGRVTQVVVRVARGWRIRAFQSTFINPNIPRGR